MSDQYIFRVQVLEGRGFGEDPQTLLCTAQFAGESKTTQYSVNTDTHIWNSTLNWSVSREELRKAQASGSTHCKVSVLRKDGTRLGWVVVSLRSAKLQSQYRSHPQGQWLQLNASKLAEPPQLRIAYALCEERLLSQLDQPLGTAATAPSSLSGGNSLSANPSLRKLSSTSAAAASLRPSKPFSGRKRLSISAAASDISSVAGVQEAPAADEGTSAEASTADIGYPIPAASLVAVGSSPELMAAGPVAAESFLTTPAQLQEQSQQQEQQSTEVADDPGHIATEAADAAAAEVATSSTDLRTSSSPAAAVAAEAEAEPGGLANGSSTAADSLTLETSSPEVAAIASSSHATGQAEHGTADDAVAAAEARLPSFAQRRQQQQQVQLQQAREQLQQQQLQPQQLQQQEVIAESRPQEAVQQVPQQAEPLQQTPDAGHGDSAAAARAAADRGAAVPADTSSRSLELAGASVHQNVPGATVESSDAPAAANTAVAAVDPVRQFVLTLDVRSFQAGRRLPLALASAYVTAFLPQELMGFLTTTCGAKLPTKLTPLRTLPAVDVLRGSEGALPNGCASVSFSAGVVGLAGLLAQEPRVVLEVWHKEKLRSDMLLGVASVSLSALLQECWVDGYAPVYALMTKAAGGHEQEEKVQVGLLRVVLSLEDKGPPTTAPAAAALTSPSIPSSFRQQQRSSSSHNHSHSPLTTPDKLYSTLTPLKQIHAPSSSTPAPAAQAATPYAQRQQQLQQGMAAAKTGRPSAAPQQVVAGETGDLSVVAAPAEMQDDAIAGAAAAAAAVAAAGVAMPPGDFRQMPEYLVAWELEVWKRAEEARFRAQLKELEQQRMSVIEAQWWKRERARESEVAAIKAEYAKLEQQTKALLTAVQEREGKLVAAEGDLRRRQSDMERQQAARMSEAEAAVRRLQVECEHQLSLERDRTAAVARQRDAAESRLLTAEARAAAMEAQFTEYRAAQRATPEAQLQIQLQEAQASAAAAQARATKAVKAKKHYKEQVLQLARELAALHQQRQQEQLQQQQKQQEEARAREQSSAAASQAAELSGLREQLAALRTAALAAAADSPAYLHSPASSDHSRHQQQHHRRRKARQRYRDDKENHPHNVQQQQQQHRGKQGVQQQHHAHLQQDAGFAAASTAAGDVYLDEEVEQFSSGNEQQGYSSASDSRDASAGESESDTECTEHPAAVSRRAKLQQLQKQRHMQSRRLEPGVDKAPAVAASGPGGAAADAAMAEVAALAAILNQPRQASAQAQQHQQQEGQQVSPVAASPAQQDTSAIDRSSAQPQQHQETSIAAAPPRQQLLSPESNPLSEVRRLLKEKVELLASGLYGRDDAVILQIDARVQALAEQQLTA